MVSCFSTPIYSNVVDRSTKVRPSDIEELSSLRSVQSSYIRVTLSSFLRIHPVRHPDESVCSSSRRMKSSFPRKAPPRTLLSNRAKSSSLYMSSNYRTLGKGKSTENRLLLEFDLQPSKKTPKTLERIRHWFCDLNFFAE